MGRLSHMKAPGASDGSPESPCALASHRASISFLLFPPVLVFSLSQTPFLPPLDPQRDSLHSKTWNEMHVDLTFSSSTVHPRVTQGLGCPPGFAH